MKPIPCPCCTQSTTPHCENCEAEGQICETCRAPISTCFCQDGPHGDPEDVERDYGPVTNGNDGGF